MDRMPGFFQDQLFALVGFGAVQEAGHVARTGQKSLDLSVGGGSKVANHLHQALNVSLLERPPPPLRRIAATRSTMLPALCAAPVSTSALRPERTAVGRKYPAALWAWCVRWDSSCLGWAHWCGSFPRRR